MNRRQFFLNGLMTAIIPVVESGMAPLARPALAQPQDASATTSMSHADVKPYGIARLEDTDLEQFRKSMLVQLRDAGLPKLRIYDPFPARQQGDAGANADEVTGESAENSFISKTRRDFDNFYKAMSVPPCDALSLQEGKLFAMWRVFAALHETAHFVAENVKANGRNLNDDVFRTVNKIGRGDLDAHEAAIDKYVASKKLGFTLANLDIVNFAKYYMDDQKFVGFLGGAISYGKMREEIADVSATLYILSNYGNTEENRGFLQQVSDYRKGRYIDSEHDTSSILDLVGTIFSQTLRKTPSIVETTHWAADIIKANTPTYDHREMLARAKLVNKAEDLQPLREFLESRPDDKKRIDGIITDIINARNRACHIGSNTDSSVRPVFSSATSALPAPARQ